MNSPIEIEVVYQNQPDCPVIIASRIWSTWGCRTTPNGRSN